jgi:hypothetical protein
MSREENDRPGTGGMETVITGTVILAMIIILIALVFDFTNGFDLLHKLPPQLA